MRLPNGFGTVYKQPGNRRNPYVAKKTKGWEIDQKTGKAKQLYTVIGYYPTRKEALTALAEFNINPYDVNVNKITFEDVYERWSSEHFPTVSDSNVKGYKAAWLLCHKIATMRFVDVKLDHLQMIVDESGHVKGRAKNAVASYLYGCQKHGTPIVGDVIFGMQNGPDILPLENADLVKFFLKDKFSYLQDAEA